MDYEPKDTPAKSNSGQAQEPALVVLDSPSFVEFDRWLDMELAALVQRWIHTAAPNANRPERNRERFAQS